MPLYTTRRSARRAMVLGRIDALNIVDLEMRLKRMELDLVNGEPDQQSQPVSAPARCRAGS
jgi:type IV pilus assembly protein PilC